MPLARAALAVLLIAVSGCATGYRKLAWADSGYEEKQLDFNNWLVSYHGSDLEFCKKAARYRAAELCKQEGFAYFRIKSEQVRSTFAARTRNPTQDPRENPTYMVENTSGLERKYAVAGYTYKVEFSKSDPKAAESYEAAAVLRDTLEKTDGK